MNGTEVFDVEGEGAFVLPLSSDVFRSAGEDVTFEISNEVDNYKVKFETSAGADAELASINPALLSSCDRDLGLADQGNTFSVALLREAFGLAKPFLAKTGEAADNRKPWKTLQIFDQSVPETAKGNGNLYAGDSIRQFYFNCTGFLDKGLAVHSDHLGPLGTFLARCQGDVVIKRSPSMTFASDTTGKHVFGWVHTAVTHTKFSYYALKADGLVMTMTVSDIGRAINYICALNKVGKAGENYIKIHFDPDPADAARGSLWLQVSGTTSKGRSPAVFVVMQPGEKPPQTFECNINIEHLQSLFDGVKGHDVELRALILPVTPTRAKQQVMLRTVDEFWLDTMGKKVAGRGADTTKIPEGVVQCYVTRFTSSMG